MSSRKVFLYRGYHSDKLFQILKSGWENNDFVLLIPIQTKDFSFLQIIKLVSFDIEFEGQWPEETKSLAIKALQIDQLTRPSDQAVLNEAVLGVFTSGTTSGRPRIVFYSKKNIVSSLESIRQLFDLKRIKNIFVYPQPTHCFGLILGYLQSIIYNHKIYFSAELYSKKAHARWIETADENTLTLGAPVHFSDLVRYVRDNNLSVKPTYSAIIGGAPVSQKLWMQTQDELKIEYPSVGYGGTEASPGLTHLPPGIKPGVDGDIGYALNGVVIKTDEKQILFSGPNACLAIYENILVKTEAEISLSDVLSKTIEHDGKERFSFIGRSDLLINRGGQKISLEKIENLVSGRFSCRCVAISFYDARLGQDIAFILETLRDDCSFNLQSAQAFIENDCGFKIPSTHILFDIIPLNANSKFDRKEALKIYLKQRTWKFPIDVGYVKSFLPHYGPAVWVDKIIKTEKNIGVTETILKTGANYFVNGILSESSLIEFVAQSYGYTVAINDILNIQNIKSVSTTLIVEVKDFQLNFNSIARLPSVGDLVQIETIGTHDFGALKLVQGKILFEGQIMASLKMKIYCS